eukprot:14346182-Alexandrium_andersonii.AAC.1
MASSPRDAPDEELAMFAEPGEGLDGLAPLAGLSPSTALPGPPPPLLEGLFAWPAVAWAVLA